MPVAYSLKREAAMGILWAEAKSLPTENHHIVLICAVMHWCFCVLNKFFGGGGIYEKIKSKKNLTNFLLCVMNRIFCKDL